MKIKNIFLSRKKGIIISTGYQKGRFMVTKLNKNGNCIYNYMEVTDCKFTDDINKLGYPSEYITK